MADYKIVFSDLDGTLLSRDMTVSEQNRIAIKEMTERGVHFVASSGRTLSGYPKDVSENPDIRYLICSNGTAIYDKSVEKNIYTKYLTGDGVSRVFDILSEYDNILFIQHDGKCYADGARHDREVYTRYNVNSYFEYFINETNVFVKDFPGFCKSLTELEMITAFFSSMEEYDECAERLRACGFKVASSARYNLEVFDADAGKGKALAALAELLATPTQETIAVGDSINDITMVEAAGLGLATANAFDELKAAADEVICSFDRHIAKYILDHYII